jgi:formamidopyrimidine-DNA glycosylase
MPELPEVETICCGLRALLPGRRAARVEVLDRRLRSRVSRDFRLRLEGRTIREVGRRGKYILVALEGGWVWISHLGMSGKLICVEASRPRERHDHIIVTLSDGHELRYHDPRRFGLSLVISAARMSTLPQLRDLGPEPFDPEFCGAYLHGVLRKSRRRVRDLLIDQNVVVGLGNIYANEILYRAGIRPTTRAWKVGRGGADMIAKTIPEVLQEAIRWCGTSFSDYRDAEDRLGEFQNHLGVYDREGERCRMCASAIKRVSLGNRSAFYCPRCQR